MDSAFSQLIEISLSVAILGAIVWFGLKQFNSTLKSHKEERAAVLLSHEKALKEKDDAHREERKEKDATIRSQEEFIRNLTKDTYEIMTQMAAKLDTLGSRTAAEKLELHDIIKEAKSVANIAVMEKLNSIGRKIGIEDSRFYN